MIYTNMNSLELIIKDFTAKVKVCVNTDEIKVLVKETKDKIDNIYNKKILL